MNHSRKLNNKINRIHERALRVAYNDENSTFDELLTKGNSVKVHDRNLHVVVTEMFQGKNGCLSSYNERNFSHSQLEL